MFTINHRRFLLGLALVGLAAASAVPPASAADTGTDTSTVTRHANASDLDLRSAAGQATLRHRIAVAALQVCEEADEGGPLGDCIHTARRGAAAQVNALIAAAQSPAQLAAAEPPR